jgi:hypothetical protein
MSTSGEETLPVSVFTFSNAYSPLATPTARASCWQIGDFVTMFRNRADSSFKNIVSTFIHCLTCIALNACYCFVVQLKYELVDGFWTKSAALHPGPRKYCNSAFFVLLFFMCDIQAFVYR